MAKNPNSEDILKIAVGKKKKNRKADFDSDGVITAEDARKRLRVEEGLDPPTYDDTYSIISEKALEEIIKNNNSYDYTFNEDPLYRQYKKMYSDEGAKAAEHVYGLASGLTGGYGNSYAASAAAGVLGDYADKLAKKTAELEERNYKRQGDEISALYKIFDAFSDADDREYKRYRDRLIEYNNKRKEEKDFAFDAAGAGDYRFLKALGIDTAALENKARENAAKFLARFGDYSGLKDMGVDLTKLNEDNLYKVARIFAKYGDYSLLNFLGADTEDRETEDYYKRLLLKARYGKYLYG